MPLELVAPARWPGNRDEVDVQFFDADHTYTLNGEPAPSVTGILSAEGLSGSEFWKEEHRLRGTQVHKIAHLIGSRLAGNSVEEIIANSRWDPARTSPGLVGYGYAVAQFYHKTGLRPRFVEQPVGSVKWGICGTLDVFGDLPNGNTLLPDFKSGLPQEAAWIQTALYAMCLEETFGIKPDLRTVVWLQPDGDCKIWPARPPGGQDLVIGQSAINLYKWRQKYGML